MKIISSAEFRKVYPRLEVPVTVTANGHVIGEWTPVHHARYVTIQEAKALIASVQDDVKTVMTNQVQRDAILRRINKGARNG